LNLERFTRERQGQWNELEGLVGDAGRRPERLGPDGVLRLGALYRAAAADLALARRQFPGDPLVRRLETLVGRARGLVYDTPPRRASLLRFFMRDYWWLIASRPVPLLFSAVLLFGSGALASAWAVTDPGAAAGLVPSEFQPVTDRRSADLGLSADEEAALSSEIFTNNIQVTLLLFAGGILLGLVTALVLVFNGVLLGVVGGLVVEAGNGRIFFELVTAHGVLELSCIVVAGAAGLRLGWAVVDPGRQTRAESVRVEAVRTVALVLGTAPWLVIAGLVEGFITPEGIGLAGVLAVGFGLAAVYWTLVLALGVRAREPIAERGAWLAGTP
jgi:uncharacterized membrane protein SpoIIM required for sporulation